MGHVFVSYSRQDRAIVDSIVNQLEEAGLDIWIDREDIQPGRQWRMQIVKAIDTADSFVIHLSPHAAQSVNVRKELDLAEDAPDPFVLPVMLENIQIPPEMRYHLAGTQRIEYYLDPEKKYQELENTLLERQVQKFGVTPVRKEVEIVIKGQALADFDDALRDKILSFLAENTGASIEDLVITRVEEGSLHVFVEMPSDSGYELKAMALNADERLLQMGITSLRFVGDKNLIPILDVPPASASGTGLSRILINGLVGGFVGVVAIIAIIFGILNSGGKLPTTSTPKKGVPTLTATFKPTATSLPPSSTTTTMPTSTPTPTPTSTGTSIPTPTATITPTPKPPMAIARTNSLCRSGPGTMYPTKFGDMVKGEEALIIGVSQDRWWVLVKLTKYEKPVDCWVSMGENGTVDVTEDLTLLPVILVPLPPTSTPTLPPPSGKVTGVLWEDWDEDQTIDGSEPRLYPIPVWLYSGYCGSATSSMIKTDSNGWYHFENLKAGDYCLYIDVSYLGTPSFAWKLSGNGNVSEVEIPFSLSAGANKTINVGFVDTEF